MNINISLRKLRKTHQVFFSLAAILIALGFVLSGFIYEREVKADNSYFVIAPGSPLFQDWTNTGLITAANDWSGVPGINGYRGDDAAAGAGVDPQTITADYSGVISVVANQTNPNTFTTGAVAEFEVANPTIALQGSGTADFPHLDIRLDTTGCLAPNVLNVLYNIRDLDGSADNSVQPVALQYRVGAAGAYTNLPGAFIADATTGPSIATLVTPLAVTMPAATMGQAQVHVRIMTSNAAGNDEVIGIDDIIIHCIAPTAAQGSIKGRAISPSGSGLRNLPVVLRNTRSGEVFKTRTSSLGYFSFQDMQIGDFYVIEINSKEYQFDSRSFTLNDNLDNLVLTAN